MPPPHTYSNTETQTITQQTTPLANYWSWYSQPTSLRLTKKTICKLGALRWEQNFGPHLQTFLQPFIWKRFIDNIFFVGTNGQKDLDNFVSNLNNCHDTIKFTLENSFTSINYLDIAITHKSDSSGSMNLYCKPTYSHNYLLYSSEHP